MFRIIDTMPKKSGCPFGQEKVQGICIGVSPNWWGQTHSRFLRHKGYRDHIMKMPLDDRPHLNEIENDELSMVGLEHKLYALDEGHGDQWLIKEVKKDIKKRRLSKRY